MKMYAHQRPSTCGMSFVLNEKLKKKEKTKKLKDRQLKSN